MAGMTPLLFVLLHNIHVAAHFLFNFVFQSDPGTEGSLSDDLGSTLTSLMDGILEDIVLHQFDQLDLDYYGDV